MVSLRTFLLVCATTTLLSVGGVDAATASQLRGGGGSVVADDNAVQQQRQLPSTTDDDEYYYSMAINDPDVLGPMNLSVTAGNPFKGIIAAPKFLQDFGPIHLTKVNNSMDFSYIGFSDIMIANNTFNWTVCERLLNDSAKRNNHVVWRVYIDYPTWPFKLPDFLWKSNATDNPVPVVNRTNSNGTPGMSPKYDHPTLLNALEQFITAFANKYDGHKRIALIQLGLLGKYGEWHTVPQTGLLDMATQHKVTTWYYNAFNKTLLQVRNSKALATLMYNGTTGNTKPITMGLHDDSFAYETVGVPSTFFWNGVKDVNLTDFWKRGMMGGETRPELQKEVFEPDYKVERFKQDFFDCVNVTHASFMLHTRAFSNTSINGIGLQNLRNAHVRMGYSFYISNIAAAVGVVMMDDPNPNATTIQPPPQPIRTPVTVSIDVTIHQVGVAPFYYPLSLALNCSGASMFVSGIDRMLVEPGATQVIRFDEVPATTQCLNKIQFSLESPNVYANERPIRFAQGTHGTVIVRVPMPQLKPPPRVQKPSIAVHSTVALGTSECGSSSSSSYSNTSVVTGIQGSIITYCFDIVNTGTSYLQNITIIDETLRLHDTTSAFTTSLGPGESVVVQYTSRITTNTSTTNTVVVTAVPTLYRSGVVVPGYEGVGAVSAFDTTQVIAIPSTPSIRVLSTVYAGDEDDMGMSCAKKGRTNITNIMNGTQLYYCFVITNTGNTYLNRILLQNAALNYTDNSVGVLAPQQSTSIVFRTKVGINSITNIALITALPALKDGSVIPYATAVTDQSQTQVITSQKPMYAPPDDSPQQCLQQQWNMSGSRHAQQPSELSCSTKHVYVKSLKATQPRMSCQPGETIQLSVDATIFVGGPLNDIGWYIATNGTDDALTGPSCIVNGLQSAYSYSVVESPTSDEVNGQVQWLTQDGGDGDQCGDVLTNSDEVYIRTPLLVNANMKCIDDNDDGYLDMAVCFTWKTKQHNNDNQCTISRNTPGSSCSCYCSNYDIPNVVVGIVPPSTTC